MEQSLHEKFLKIGQIETDRLILRRLCEKDAEDVYAYSHDPRTSKYLLWSPHETLYFTRRHLDRVIRCYERGEYHDLAVVWKETGRVIGTAGYTLFHENHAYAEIGYVLHPDYWGKGIAAEAAAVLIDYGFTMLRLHRIEAHYMAENAASARVMEKCGMRFEGIHREQLYVKEQYRDIGIYAILEEDYHGENTPGYRVQYADRTHWYDRLR